MSKKGCGKRLAKGQWWGYCGETDMGQTLPALCTECGGQYKLAIPHRIAGPVGKDIPIDNRSKSE